MSPVQYKFFNNSEKTWGAMFEAVKEAKKSVYLEMYTFADGIENYDFVKLFQEKAQSGLNIKMILDSVGSRDLSKKSIAILKDSGIELFFVGNFLHRTHRKILIVDESLAFIGGVNFSKAAQLWDDLTVEIKGGLVKYIIRSFAKVYKECGGKDPAVLSHKRGLTINEPHTWLVEHFPIRKNFTLKKIYKKHLRESKRKIVLVTPYFAPKMWLVKALREAVSRRVKVEILVPKSTDLFFADHVTYSYVYKLSKSGVDFYVQPKMNHAKIMVIDDEEAMVGSQNLDFLSFDLNNEIGVFFRDQKEVKEIAEIAEKWKTEASLFNPKTYKSSIFDYILYPVIGILSRIIR